MNKIILALDTSNLTEAINIAKKVKDKIFTFKVGLELFNSSGKEGIKKFNEEKIQIRSFFAPNHTYDKNTLYALKNSGIKEIIDGYYGEVQELGGKRWDTSSLIKRFRK